MLRFFRQIRQRLLTENRVGKYLLYAIGEILLVVIGILIALQIDNWNDRRKTLEKIHQILGRVHEELEVNIDETTFLYSNMYQSDSLLYRLVEGNIKRADLESDITFHEPLLPNLFMVHQGYITLSLTQNSYDQLVANIDNIPPEYLPVLDELVDLYETEKRKLWEEQDILFDMEKKNYTYRTNLDFYRDHAMMPMTENEKFYQYILNDPDFRSENLRWLEVKEAQRRWSTEFRTQAIKCYDMITDLLQVENPKSFWNLDDELKLKVEGEYIHPGFGNFHYVIKNDRLMVKQTNSNFEIPLHQFDYRKFASGFYYVRFEVIGDSVRIYSPKHTDRPFGEKILD